MTNEDINKSVIETQTLCRQNAEDIKALTMSLSKVADKLDAKSGINWSAVGLLIPLIGGAWVLVNTQIGAVRDVVRSYESRMQMIENTVNRSVEYKARQFDNLIYDKVTNP